MKEVRIYENYVKDGNVLLLCFEERLNKDYYAPNNSVCRTVEEVIRLMDKYGFQLADIINKETGEILACVNVFE